MISNNDTMDVSPESSDSAFVELPRPARKPRPARRGPKLKDLFSRPDIDLILQRECARSERTGREMSLVIIKPATDDPQRHLLRLAKLLGKRARTTDEIGWYDQDRLCVVLPDTSFAGAQQFVAQFTDEALFNALAPVCRTMTYPSDWHPDALETSARYLSDDHTVEAMLVKPMPRWKRALDLALGGIALAASLPILGATAVGVYLCGDGQIFAREERAGLGGRPFNMFTFRTTKIELDENGEYQESQFTRIGQFLRETGIEQLPLLWNVMRGDLSLVGPRPLPLDDNRQGEAWRRRRLDVTPGLTCIAQVTPPKPGPSPEIRMDRSYIGWQSLLGDLRLILLSLPRLFLRRKPQQSWTASLSPLWPVYGPERRKLLSVETMKNLTPATGVPPETAQLELKVAQNLPTISNPSNL